MSVKTLLVVALAAVIGNRAARTEIGRYPGRKGIATPGMSPRDRAGCQRGIARRSGHHHLAAVQRNAGNLAPLQIAKVAGRGQHRTGPRHVIAPKHRATILVAGRDHRCAVHDNPGGLVGPRRAEGRREQGLNLAVDVGLEGFEIAVAAPDRRGARQAGAGASGHIDRAVRTKGHVGRLVALTRATPLAPQFMPVGVEHRNETVRLTGECTGRIQRALDGSVQGTDN